MYKLPKKLELNDLISVIKKITWNGGTISKPMFGGDIFSRFSDFCLFSSQVLLPNHWQTGRAISGAEPVKVDFKYIKNFLPIR